MRRQSSIVGSLCQDVVHVNLRSASTLTYSQLKKLKKRGALPEADAETYALVERMLTDLTLQSRDPASQQALSGSGVTGATRSSPGDRSARSRFISAIDKKAQSVVHFLRRMRTPRSATKSDSTSGKIATKPRARSAGRLEGNRIFHFDNDVTETSIDRPSTSSELSSGAPVSSSSPSDAHKSSSATGSDVSGVSPASQPSRFTSPSTKRSPKTSDPATPGNTTPSGQVPAQKPAMLKSLDTSTSGANAIYKTFKEKQSPSYRRKTDATPMRPHGGVFTAVDIPLQDEPASSPAG